jgi:hypothetical protein
MLPAAAIRHGSWHSRVARERGVAFLDAPTTQHGPYWSRSPPKATYGCTHGLKRTQLSCARCGNLVIEHMRLSRAHSWVGALRLPAKTGDLLHRLVRNSSGSHLVHYNRRARFSCAEDSAMRSMSRRIT